MTDKTFTVAGVSTLNGKTKVRFANDIEQRVYMLEYTGHTDIMLLALPSEMTKEQAVLHLAKTLRGEHALAAVNDWLKRNKVELPVQAAKGPLRDANGRFIKRAA